MSAKIAATVGLGIALALFFSSLADAHDVANGAAKSHSTAKNRAGSQRQIGETRIALALKVDALLRAQDLKPGFQASLPNEARTTLLSVVSAPQGKTIQLIDLKSRGVIAEWHLAAASPAELRAVSNTVFQRMALTPPPRVNNKPVPDAKLRRR